MIKKKMFTKTLFYIAISVALITQFPSINKSIASSINSVIWILLIGFIMVNNIRNIPISKYLYSMGIIMWITYIAESTLFLLGIVPSMMPYITLIRIPIMVYYCSYFFSFVEDNDGRSSKIMILVFAVCAFIMSVQVASKFITNFDAWRSTELYLYDGATHKNSSSQTLGNCLLIFWVYWKPKKMVENIAKYIGILVVVMGLLYIQSRSALVAIACAVIASALFKGDVKNMLKYIIATVIVVIVVYNSKFIMSLIQQAFFIDKYSTNGNLDINRFSSGRLDFWKNCWDNFLNSPLIGNGYTYCDNFYINSLSSGGLLIGIPYIWLYFIRVKKNITAYKRELKRGGEISIYQLCSVVSIFYLVISMFEGFPPYGPGVSCIFFWILSGYIDGAQAKRIL